MDVVAARAGLAPDALQLHRPGPRPSAIGQVMREPVENGRAARIARWSSRVTAENARHSIAPNGESPVKRGVEFLHRFCTAPVLRDQGEVAPGLCRRRGSDNAEAMSRARGHTEIGQGTNTIFAQIIATRGDRIRPGRGRTAGHRERAQQRPDGRVAHGNGGRQTRRDPRTHVGNKPWSTRESSGPVAPATRSHRLRRTYIGTHGRAPRESHTDPPPGIERDDEAYRGDAYGAYAWAVYVAAVSVDPATWERRIDDFVALQEIRRVLHPCWRQAKSKAGSTGDWLRPP